MDQHLAEMKRSRIALASICRKLQWVFFGVFAIYCVAYLAILFFAFMPPEGFSPVGPANALELLPLALKTVAGAYALLLIGLMFRSCGKGNSPFSRYFVRHLKILGVLFLACVVAGLFITPGTQFGAVTDTSEMIVDYGTEREDLSIDVTILFVAIACFALSTIFRYGALLQDEVENLM